MFRVSRQGEGIDDAETIEGAREVVRGQPPGGYDVDEIRADPFPSRHTSRQSPDDLDDPATGPSSITQLTTSSRGPGRRVLVDRASRPIG